MHEIYMFKNVRLWHSLSEWWSVITTFVFEIKELTINIKILRSFNVKAPVYETKGSFFKTCL